MSKVNFKRVATKEEIENIPVEDGNFIVTGDGSAYIDYLNERKQISGGISSNDYDSIPVGAIIDFDGDEVPVGYKKIDDQNTYSSNEIVIGKWFDKTLYRRTIYRSVLINGTEETVNHNIENVDLLWCNLSKTFVIWPELGITNNLPFLNLGEGSNSISISDFSSTSFKLKSTIDRSNLRGYITLEYTKKEVSE